jgi:hypothetical protein
MTNGGLGREIRPFASIHQNSGVFHDPKHGTSGVLRYTRVPQNFEQGFFEMSVDGGANFARVVTGSVVTQADLPNSNNDIVGQVEFGSHGSGFVAVTLGGFGATFLFAVDNLGLSGLWGFPTQGFNGKVVNELTDFNGTRAQGAISVVGASGIVVDIIGNTMTIVQGAGTALPPTGNIVPDASGTRHIGFEPVGDILRPYASIHQNSGVFHGTFGGSGIISFVDPIDDFRSFPGGQNRVDYGHFAFSADGGITNPLLIGARRDPLGWPTLPDGATLRNINGPIHILSSGLNINTAGQGMTINAFDGGINFGANFGITIQSDLLLTLMASRNGNIIATAGTSALDGGQISLSPFGGSGTLSYQFGPHQGWYIKTSHSSTGGPFNDGSWPIAHSGNVNQLLNAAVATLNTSINALGADLQSNLVPDFSGVRYIGWVGYSTKAIRPYAHVHQNSGVFHNPTRGSSGVIRFQNSALTSPSNGDYFGFSFDGGKWYPFELGINKTLEGIGADLLAPHGGMRVLASGALSLHSVNDNVELTTAAGDIVIAPVGNEIHNVTGLYSENVAGNRSSSAQDESHTVDDNFSVVATNGVINFETLSDVGDITLNSVADVMLEAFNHSGVLSYRFGRHQSWYIKTTHSNTGGPYNDGFWPIAHSGNVAQMIAQAGGGSIPGNTGDVFFNNAGALATDSLGLTFNDSINALGVSGQIQFGRNNSLSIDATAKGPRSGSGVAQFSAINLAERPMFGASNSGMNLPYFFQPALFTKHIFMVMPSVSTLVSTYGNTSTNAGTISHPAAGVGSGFMANFVTGASANSAAGTGSNNTLYYRGAMSGVNTGFFYATRITLPDANLDGGRVFAGLTAGLMANMVTADDPAGDYCGFQFTTTQANPKNWHFITKDGTAQNRQDTGISCSGNRIWDMYIYSPPFPNNNVLYWTLHDVSWNRISNGYAINRLPRVNTIMRPGFQLNNLTASARNIRMQHLYCEGL